jgi:hypothetical protein
MGVNDAVAGGQAKCIVSFGAALERFVRMTMLRSVVVIVWMMMPIAMIGAPDDL